MSVAEEVLRRYLTLPKAWPMTFPMAWDERCEAVIHKTPGTTVAFRAEIEAALGALFRDGLVPPFVSVLVGFKLIRAAAAGGGALGDVDSGLWREPMATAHVVVHILEQGGAPRDPERAAVLWAGLQAGLPREGVTDEESSLDGERLLLAGKRLVEAGIAKADPDEILRRVRTGISDEVQAAPLEWVLDPGETALNGAEAVAQLLRELESDDDHGELARLAYRLMAPLRLPRAAALHEDLPIGGYADIANRGEIDRLLLSELAQDDDVLASRIVLGEAMFLRREVPKDVPRQDLTVVVDSGIRMWGTARVFGTAATLAVAASADRGASVTAYRAQGEALEPMDLGTKDGLEEHLGKLYPDPHPGPAVLQASGNSVAGQRVLVTTRAAFQRIELREALGACGADWAVVAVDAEGHVELFEYSARGVRLVSSALVSLEETGAQGRRPNQKGLPQESPDLPLYFRESPAPLRIGHALDRGIAVAHPDGVLVITRRRQVVFWRMWSEEAASGTRRGAQELGTLPSGVVMAFGPLPEGAVVAIYDGKQRVLWRAEFSFDGRTGIQEYPVKKEPWVALSGGSSWDLKFVKETKEPSVVLSSRSSLVLKIGKETMVAAPEGLRSTVVTGVPWQRALAWGTGMELLRGAGIVTLPLLQNVQKIGVTKTSSATAEIRLLMGDSVWSLIVHRRKSLQLGQFDSVSGEVSYRPFELRRGSVPATRILRHCQLPGGPRAWIDQRGLLHLRALNGGGGDLTLTLDIAQEPAAWSSRGWTYHQGEAVLGRPELLDKVNRWLLNFAGEVTEAIVGQQP